MMGQQIKIGCVNDSRRRFKNQVYLTKGTAFFSESPGFRQFQQNWSISPFSMQLLKDLIATHISPTDRATDTNQLSTNSLVFMMYSAD